MRTLCIAATVASALAPIAALSVGVRPAHAHEQAHALAHGAQPLPFVPFRVEEIIDPATGAPALPRAHLDIVLDGRSYYRGSAEHLLQLLNDIERRYTALGQSLRQSGDLWSAVAMDPLALRQQLLHDLGIAGPGALRHVGAPLAACPHLTLAMLADLVPEGIAVTGERRLLVQDETFLSAAELVERINAQQDLLCALGWDIVGGPRATGDGRFAGVMARRQVAMRTLGISRFHRSFVMRPMAPLRPFGELTAEADRAAAERRVPTVLDLRRLRGELPAVPAYQVPDLPPVPTVEQPPARPLVLHKRKDWEGMHLGDRRSFAVEADGFYGLDGTPTSRRAEGMAQASAHVAGHEVKLLRARAVVRGSEGGSCAAVFLEVMGRTVAEDLQTGEGKLRLAHPELLGFSFKKGFTQTTAIGPIPVTFTEGVEARLDIAAEIVVDGVGLAAQLTPKADARGFATGALGIDWAGLSVGAGCNLAILELTAPLQGRTSLALRHDVEPALVSHIDVGLGYGALRGRVFLSAKVPTPRWGLPPFEVKTVHHTLFDWPGFDARHRLVGWGLDLSAHGARLLGDLPDQEDLDEAGALQASIDAEQLERDLVRRENAAAEHEARVHEAIGADAGGEPALRVARDLAHLTAEHAAVAALLRPYQENLATLLRELRFDAGVTR